MDRQDGQVLIVRATKKLLDRIGPPTLRDGEQSTTLLGQWYATALPWRPQVALLVNEPTLLPVLMPLAPAATLPARTAQHIAAILAAHATPDAVIEQELRHMRDYRIATTANRSVVGIMNEFRRLAEIHRDSDPRPDLTNLAQRLATTPCSPLYDKNVSPDRELAAFLHTSPPPAGSLAANTDGGEVSHSAQGRSGIPISGKRNAVTLAPGDHVLTSTKLNIRRSNG